MKRWHVALLGLLLVAGCQAKTPDIRESTTPQCPELLKQSRAVGVDYVPTMRLAAKGDAGALSALFELTGSPAFDDNAEQCHVEALAELLNRLGDVQFAQALASESPEIRRAVVSGLTIELFNLPTADQSREAFANHYPQTASVSR